ncbi:CPBP family intramembrane metalloprotease [Candidatus Uhrbacteria bacterium]|nr:CPBP family intramembrane metalloprotease [Candidatus Uhrbacteria bacterium]
MTARKKKEEKVKGHNSLLTAIGSIIVIAIVKALWPQLIPIETWSLWKSTGGFGDWIKVGWPIFAWGLGINLIFTFIRDDDHRDYAGFRHFRDDGLRLWITGTLISLRAGIVEEIAYRWLIFLAAIAMIRIPNFLFFGFLGFGIPEWFHNHVWGPVANWTTFQQLQPYIFSEYGWAAGAAMLTSNSFFRDGHKYQGLFGIINAWFLGMFFFWIMFTHGLWAAIVVHTLYDFLIFTYAAAYVSFKNSSARRRSRRSNGY